MRILIKKHLFNYITLALMAIIIFTSPLFSINLTQPNYFSGSFVPGKIVEILDEELQPHPALEDRFLGSQLVKVKILKGEYKGEIFEVNNPLSSEHYVLVKPGTKVIINMTTHDGEPNAWIFNYKDDSILLILLGLFFFFMIIFGKSKGIQSVLSLIFTGVLIVFVLLPLIFNGYSPPLVAIGIASLSTVVTFLLVGGWHYKSLSAILGTIGGVIMAGLISWAAGKLTHLSGLTMENSQQLLFVVQDYRIKISGLMFTAILISSLGAIMDVAMSVASSTFEIYEHNPTLEAKKLLRSSMNIGMDIMGTMSNTLILTFVGGSLNTMLLIWGYQMSYNQWVSIPLIKTEIVQSLAGSIGIILTVPLTALLSVYFATKKNI